MAVPSTTDRILADSSTVGAILVQIVERISLGDIKWLAGLLEGEGCFLNQGSITVHLNMSDPDIVERAGRIMHGTPSPPVFRTVGMPQYSVRIFGARAAGWMMTLYPLMGARRQAQITTALGRWHTQPLPTCKL